MEVFVDARGKACPEPVIMTKKALDSMESGCVLTAVDNEISRDNVVKLAKSQGMPFLVKEKDWGFEITIEKSPREGGIKDAAEGLKDKGLHLPPDSDYVILISKNTLGIGAEELGKILLRNYMNTLKEASHLPSAMLFVNSGVFLTTEGSEVLETLRELEKMGVEILSCGTCLDYYHLKEKLMVGKVTNMFEIVEKTTGKRTVCL
ncbi:MAG TPA: sulfurtransferase-like selenium metabolism protein YedF [Thermoanaerobacterales bacterium]|nr:sulfurtransferase-like selenium metabolism protein YedF [Thermoanaerobacterales bacterium]